MVAAIGIAHGAPPRLPLEPISPAVLDHPQLFMARDGARMAGVRGDAVVAVNPTEHARRSDAGLGPVTDLGLLDLLMELPLGAPVAVQPREMSMLTRSRGLVQICEGRVTRLVEQPVLVQAAIVSGSDWTRLLQRASAFEGVCQRVVLLDTEPRNLDARLWEADMLGIGVWCRTGPGRVREVLAPAVFVPSYFKPARWRFQENAYAAYLRQASASDRSQEGVNGMLSARNQPGQSRVASGRRSRTTDAGSDPHQGSFQFG